MITLTANCDISHLGLLDKTQTYHEFIVEFKTYKIATRPILDEELKILEEISIPFEESAKAILHLRIFSMRGGYTENYEEFATNKFTLQENTIQDFFDEDFPVEISIKLDKPQEYLVIPGLFFKIADIFDDKVIPFLRVAIETKDEEITVKLNKNLQMVRSVVIPSAKEFVLKLKICEETLECPIFSCSLQFAEVNETISVTSEVIDYNHVLAVFALRENNAEIANFGTFQNILSLGEIVREDFYSFLYLQPKHLRKQGALALKIIQKAEFREFKSFALRLFVNYTFPLEFYTINKFNSFAPHFQKPRMPFMIYNFAACNELGSAWMIMAKGEQKIGYHTSNLCDLSVPFTLQFSDCEGCVAFLREEEALYETLPEMISLLETDVPVGDRLSALLATTLVIIVILNEKQYFKLPIQLGQYKESVENSIIQNNEYKIQLEVKFAGIMVTFTFNFEIFDVELQQLLKTQKNVVEVTKTEPVEVKAEETKCSNLKLALPPVQRQAQPAQSMKEGKRRRVKKTRRAETSQNSQLSEKAEEPGDSEDLGSDSLELDNDLFNTEVSAVKKNKGHGKKRVVKRKRHEGADNKGENEPSEPGFAPIGSTTLPSITPRRYG